MKDAPTITRDDLVELTCGHLATPDPEDPNGSTYCSECGLHLMPVAASIDRQFILDRAQDNLETSLERLRRTYDARNRVGRPLGDNIEGLIAQHERALKRIAAGAYGWCTECHVEIDSERLRLFPHSELCLRCKSKQEGIPVPAKQGAPKSAAVDPATDGVAEAAASVPATENVPGASAASTAPTTAGDEGEGGASASPDPDGNQTSSGAGPDERTYADLAIPKLHGGGNMLQSIPVDKIKPSPENPRDDIGDVKELAQSIASIGLLNPVVVTPNGADEFHLVAGHRRLAAAKLLEWTEIPTQVWNTLSDKERAEAMLIENLQRTDLSPLEEAKAYRRLVDDFNTSQRELSERIGRSQSHVSKRLSLLALPEPAVELVVKGPDSGGITLEDAQKLQKVKSEKTIARIVKDFTPGDHYRTIDRLVESAVKSERATERKKKLAAKLKADGVKVISSDALYKVDYDKRASIGTHYGYLDVPLEEHKAEECHAVLIDDGGRAQHYCLNKSRHTKKGASKVKGTVVASTTQRLSRRDVARDNRQKALKEASERRREFVQKNLGKKKAKPDDVFALLCLTITADDASNYGSLDTSARQVCDFLEIEVPNAKARYYDENYRRVLRELIAQDPATPAHVATAMAVANVETAIDAMPWDDDVDYRPYQPYFGWLEKLGYELSDFEVAELAEKKPESDEETPAA